MIESDVPVYNFAAEKGVALSISMRYKDGAGVPVNLTGWSGVIRFKGFSSAGVESIALTLGSDGSVKGRVPASSLDFKKGRYVIDLTPPTEPEFRFVKGEINVEESWL